MSKTSGEKFIISFLKEYLGGEEYVDLDKDIEDVDWEKITYQVVLHRIIPIFMHYMREKNKINILNTYIENLFSSFEKQALERDVLRIAEASRISNLIIQNNLNAVIVKGPLSSLAIYDNYGSRVYEDIDILVEKHDLRKVKDVLFKEGFQQGRVDPNEKSFNKASRQDILEKEMYSHETIEFYKFVDGKRTDIMIDVNHSLSWKGHSVYEGYPDMKIEDFISSRKTYSKDEYTLIGPSMEELLAYTILHLFNEEVFFVWEDYWKYNFGDIQLLKYSDVIMCMKKDIDWKRFHKYVSECHIEDPIKNVVTKIYEVFGRDILPGELHCYIDDIKNVDYFYDKHGQKLYWLSDFKERMLNQNTRIKEVKERNIEL